MQSKAKMFNLALGALLLNRRITNVETDTSNECKVLEAHYETAFLAALEDMDLDATSTEVTLQLVTEDPNDRWLYAYKYPANCAFVRRIITMQVTDTRDTRIPLRTGIYDSKKVILTNEAEASAEIIMNDIPLSALSANAFLACALKLASLATPLIVGKGAAKLMETIEKRYVIAKAEAQRHDQRENLNFLSDEDESEFVKARTE